MKLKRELLKIFKYYTLSRGVPCESLRPKDSENVVLFVSSRFKSGVIGSWSQVKIQKKKWWKCGVKKKSHGHNFWIFDLKFNHALDIYISEGVIQFQSLNPKIVAVTFFFNTSYLRWRFQFCRHVPTLSSNNSR